MWICLWVLWARSALAARAYRGGEAGEEGAELVGRGALHADARTRGGPLREQLGVPVDGDLVLGHLAALGHVVVGGEVGGEALVHQEALHAPPPEDGPQLLVAADKLFVLGVLQAVLLDVRPDALDDLRAGQLAA